MIQVGIHIRIPEFFLRNNFIYVQHTKKYVGQAENVSTEIIVTFVII